MLANGVLHARPGEKGRRVREEAGFVQEKRGESWRRGRTWEKRGCGRVPLTWVSGVMSPFSVDRKGSILCGFSLWRSSWADCKVRQGFVWTSLSLLGAVSSGFAAQCGVSRSMSISAVRREWGELPFPLSLGGAGSGAGKPCWTGTWRRIPFSLCCGSPARLLISKVLKCSGSVCCHFKEYKLPFMNESGFEVDPVSRLWPRGSYWVCISIPDLAKIEDCVQSHLSLFFFFKFYYYYYYYFGHFS